MNSILSGPCTVVQAAPGKTIIALIVQETHTRLTRSLAHSQWTLGRRGKKKKKKLSPTTSELAATDEMHVSGTFG